MLQAFLAQLVERVFSKHKVMSSNLIKGSNNFYNNYYKNYINIFRSIYSFWIIEETTIVPN